jgi:hypothetical protein
MHLRKSCIYCESCNCCELFTVENGSCFSATAERAGPVLCVLGLLVFHCVTCRSSSNARQTHAACCYHVMGLHDIHNT